MSILSDKYKIPEPTIKNMIKDGVISCKYVGWEQVLQLHTQGKTVDEISDECNIATRTVRHILQKFR
jgi:hypothetical protein